VLPELLSSSTAMPVAQVKDGMVVAPNHVYVIPPATVMQVVDGRLRLAPRAEKEAHRTPIDIFLGSLASYADGKGIAVILSGSGTDGVVGLRQIKAAGGIALVQDPDSARFEGMPRAAVATSLVDFVGAPEELAAELARIARHPYLESAPGSNGGLDVRDEDLPPIYTLLRRATDVDFSAYKTATIRRRLQRRMALHKLHAVSEYTRLLRDSPTRRAPSIRTS
jgi:two-component system CheB/CheR fusion protein